MTEKRSKSRDSKEFVEKADQPGDAKKRSTVAKVVATTGLVAGMSGNWKQPVLSTVALPAHARTTCPDDGAPDGDDLACDGLVDGIIQDGIGDG